MTGPRILVAYHTTEGHTAEVAERIHRVLADRGATAMLFTTDDAPDPSSFDGAVVGGSIHVGHHARDLVRYVGEHAPQLNAMPSALFQVSLTSANPDEEHTDQARAFVDELLEQTGFEPDAVAMFAGALVYTRYGWIKRHLMKRIAAKEGGDTDTSADYDYTDWEAVERFADDVYEHVAASAGATPEG